MRVERTERTRLERSARGSSISATTWAVRREDLPPRTEGNRQEGLRRVDRRTALDWGCRALRVGGRATEMLHLASLSSCLSRPLLSILCLVLCFVPSNWVCDYSTQPTPLFPLPLPPLT